MTEIMKAAVRLYVFRFGGQKSLDTSFLHRLYQQYWVVRLCSQSYCSHVTVGIDCGSDGGEGVQTSLGNVTADEH
jgi:hypothetical protein